jgi:hypothetical protein
MRLSVQAHRQDPVGRGNGPVQHPGVAEPVPVPGQAPGDGHTGRDGLGQAGHQLAPVDGEPVGQEEDGTQPRFVEVPADGCSGLERVGTAVDVGGGLLEAHRVEPGHGHHPGAVPEGTVEDQAAGRAPHDHRRGIGGGHLVESPPVDVHPRVAEQQDQGRR